MFPIKFPLLSAGTPEAGIKESGIIYYFHQSGKGHKRKGAETERSIKERGIKERGIREKGIIKYWSNRKGA
jgi:hypothetical protein